MAVMTAERGWAAAAKDQDLDRGLSYMADDATMFPPAGGPVVGKAAIRDFVATAFATPGFSVHWEPLEVVVADGGDLAYTQARSVYTSRAPDGTLQTLHAREWPSGARNPTAAGAASSTSGTRRRRRLTHLVRDALCRDRRPQGGADEDSHNYRRRRHPASPGRDGQPDGPPDPVHPWLFAVRARLESAAGLGPRREHRLVALDMRGHGLSGKPRDGYADSRLWADDVNAAIRGSGLDHPILSGWSYGPLVILDYIRHYGEDDIGGMHFVGGVTKLGSEAAMSVLDPGFLGSCPASSRRMQRRARAASSRLLRLCFVQEPSAAELYLMLGYNLSVPPYVRQALFSRSFDNDDLLPKIRKPVLITHGAGTRSSSQPWSTSTRRACLTRRFT